MSDDSKNTLIYRIFDDHNFGRDSCFLCGVDLSDKNRSDEHVFPKWVLEKFHLWDQSITLLNHTSIPYRQLTIPCCRNCNNTHLSNIENQVKQAFSGGIEAVRDLDRHTLFIWLSKIHFGILYKEHILHLNRRDESEGTILTEEDLENYGTHHAFLQSVRVPFEFLEFFPASFSIYNVQLPDDDKHHFDYRDTHSGLHISIRLGEIGNIASLQDRGTLGEIWEDRWADIVDHKLHPLQFLELTVRWFYEASLMNRTPKYLIMEAGGTIRVFQTPLAGLSTKPLFDEWKIEAFAKNLAHMLDMSINDVYEPPNQIRQWIFDEDNNFQFIDIEHYPWPIP